MPSLWELTGRLWDSPAEGDPRSPYLASVLAEVDRRKKAL